MRARYIKLHIQFGGVERFMNPPGPNYYYHPNLNNPPRFMKWPWWKRLLERIRLREEEGKKIPSFWDFILTEEDRKWF